MTKLQDLCAAHGQSPWLDDLKRSYLQDGTLSRFVANGIRGVTSNPSIFAKAISGEDTYDDEFGSLIKEMDVLAAYWRLVTDDVTNACGVLRPVHDQAGGHDGFVSVEVAPQLAHDTAGTVDAARHLHQTIDRPNLMVKIPATAAGVPAIETMIAEGRNINVTLIFGLERYDEVIEAYIAGLETLVGGGGDPSTVASVASFFVSRVDTETDRRLEAAGAPADTMGKAAVANAKLAYDLFERRFSGSRWEALAAKGAHVQRPLWASTSTKNKAYPDLLYVDNLIGPNTVNTLPEATIAAFEDHGTLARTVDQGVDAAREAIDGLASYGVDFADVARVLEDEGVATFAKAFDELIQALTDKANALGAAS